MSNSLDHYFETSDGAKIRYRFWPHPRILHKEGISLETPPETSFDVLILQGRASFMEKFDRVVEGLQARNYRVWAFDWRGQGLSSRHLKDSQRSHIDSYDTYLDDLDQFVRAKILPYQEKPLILLAHSMGGHLSLRYLHQHPSLVGAAVLIAPMIELKTGIYPKTFARFFTSLATCLGFQDSYVFGHGSYDPKKEPFEGNFLTHDRETFFHHRQLQIDRPDLSLRGVTFGWVKATFDSMAKVNQPSFLSQIKTPILMMLAGREELVENRRIPAICAALPNCYTVVYPQAKHQILMETRDILEAFWQDFDTFVKEQEGGVGASERGLTKGRLIKGAQFPGMQRNHSPSLNNLNCFQSNG